MGEKRHFCFTKAIYEQILKSQNFLPLRICYGFRAKRFYNFLLEILLGKYPQNHKLYC